MCRASIDKSFYGRVMQAAKKDSHPEINEFEKELHKHANTEEEVFFLK